MSTLGYDILNDKKKLFLDDKENNLACRLYIQVDICCIALFQVHMSLSCHWINQG